MVVAVLDANSPAQRVWPLVMGNPEMKTADCPRTRGCLVVDCPVQRLPNVRQASLVAIFEPVLIPPAVPGRRAPVALVVLVGLSRLVSAAPGTGLGREWVAIAFRAWRRASSSVVVVVVAPRGHDRVLRSVARRRLGPGGLEVGGLVVGLKFDTRLEDKSGESWWSGLRGDVRVSFD